jgi:hypothetical protein
MGMKLGLLHRGKNINYKYLEVLRKIFKPNTAEITAQFRVVLHNMDHHDLDGSVCTIRTVKSRRL